MQALGQINAKLDQIINQLNRIENTMIRQHRETMEALEAIAFDVRRIHTTTQRESFQKVIGPCVRAGDTANPDLGRREANLCFSGILEQMFPREVGARLTVYANLEQTQDGTNAHKQWTQIARAHELVFRNVLAQCPSLVRGRLTLADLANDQVRTPLSSVSEDLCRDIADPTKLVDSSLISQLVAEDIRVSRQFWDEKQRDDYDRRWRYELRVLNLALGQQSALSGLIDMQSIGRFLFQSTTPAEYEREEARLALVASLRSYPVLAENALRSELWRLYGKTGTAQARYAFSFYANDPMFLNAGRASRASGEFRDGAGDTYCFDSQSSRNSRKRNRRTRANRSRSTIAFRFRPRWNFKTRRSS